MIVDKQWTDKKNNNIARLMKKATLKKPSASIEDIEYYPDRKLDKDLIILYNLQSVSISKISIM